MKRINKLRVCEVLSVLVYSVGVGIYSAMGQIQAYEDGFANGAKTMSDAYELKKEMEDLLKKNENKEDKNETAKNQ